MRLSNQPPLIAADPEKRGKVQASFLKLPSDHEYLFFNSHVALQDLLKVAVFTLSVMQSGVKVEIFFYIERYKRDPPLNLCNTLTLPSQKNK